MGKKKSKSKSAEPTSSSPKDHKHRSATVRAQEATAISREDHQAELHMLQIDLAKLQRHFIGCSDRILVLLEGRDSAGKDGCIKCIAAHLSPRETRIIALGKPSDRDRRGWYFQRYVPHLPVAEELVLFKRSWYNRADDKRHARLNLIRDILSHLQYAGKKAKLVQPDSKIAFEFSPECIEAGRLAH